MVPESFCTACSSSGSAALYSPACIFAYASLFSSEPVRPVPAGGADVVGVVAGGGPAAAVTVRSTVRPGEVIVRTTVMGFNGFGAEAASCEPPRVAAQAAARPPARSSKSTSGINHLRFLSLLRATDGGRSRVAACEAETSALAVCAAAAGISQPVVPASACTAPRSSATNSAAVE